ncbi:hypothetical protein MFIFM68171_02887 [Madurella fahalii]|uniref:SRR1-like domain-containing protein n=1 Tax=Madurella fahalii TaxID=1157608 RepID=A0ABQ0G4K4_9PEZI
MASPAPPGDHDMASSDSEHGPTVVLHCFFGNKYPEYKFELTDDPQAERERAMREVPARIRSLYEQGTPFFSKSTFRDVVAQLDHARAHPNPAGDAGCHIISIPRVDGTLAEFELETGPVKSDIPGTESVVRGHPFLHYRTYQEMAIVDDPYIFSPYLAYCSIRLTYPLTMRRISTGEVLTSWSSNPLDVVQSALDATIRAWEESEDCRRLRSSLETALLPRITKIVAFACSTMAALGDRQPPMYQHALILTLRDILERRQGADQPQIACFAQDPVYTEADREVLARLDIKVLEDPRAFLEVDDDTLVISVAPNIPVRQIIADIARPAIMIWDRVESEAESAATWGPQDPGRRRVALGSPG